LLEFKSIACLDFNFPRGLKDSLATILVDSLGLSIYSSSKHSSPLSSDSIKDGLFLDEEVLLGS